MRNYLGPANKIGSFLKMALDLMAIVSMTLLLERHAINAGLISSVCVLTLDALLFLDFSTVFIGFLLVTFNM